MKSKVKKISQKYTTLFNKIGEMIVSVRGRVLREINKGQVILYWQIGRYIVEFEQKGKIRAEYGSALLNRLAVDLMNRYGRGFSQRNLEQMRQFYLTYQISQTASAKFDLSWSHYCELLKEDNPLARLFYEKEAVENNWSIRELKRQMNAMLFERLALSKNKKKVLEMAKHGQMIVRPEDVIKDPYILEFLNLKEEVSYSEGQLEQALIDKLQYFLLELGKGFSFVTRQKRITITNRHYYIDLVFYNRLLKCFVLIDLKSGELDHADIGQMNFYLNYFKENEKGPDENDPIGLILCAKKNEVFAKYVLGGVNNKIFASKYKLALPSEKQLHNRLMLKGRKDFRNA
ncbi:MAG: DUF1016 domain-containing protein [Chlamydiae bacterium]|nr:DUF1016 domain-containing protein [Chlamydiota bacterium]